MMKRLDQGFARCSPSPIDTRGLEPRLEVGPGSPSVPGFLELRSGAHARHLNRHGAKSSSRTSNAIPTPGPPVFWGASFPNLTDNPGTLTAHQPAPSRLSRGPGRAPCLLARVTAAEIEVPYANYLCVSGCPAGLNAPPHLRSTQQKKEENSGDSRPAAPPFKSGPQAFPGARS